MSTNIPIQPLELTSVKNKGCLQAPSKGLRVRPAIGEANFLTNRLIEAIASLHYKQSIYTYMYTRLFIRIAAAFSDVYATTCS
jgi:hypothetical protein